MASSTRLAVRDQKAFACILKQAAVNHQISASGAPLASARARLVKDGLKKNETQ